MGFTGKGKSSGGDGWGTEFLLVFFPDEDHNQNKKSRLFSNPISLPFNRTNSSQILQKTQSTISICLFLLFATILLFTMSTFPSSTTTAVRRLSRRNLISSHPVPTQRISPNLRRALQGMGTLYRRGTGAMNDVVVAHGVESLTQHELILFLRLFHRSATASKSDLIFLFPSNSPLFDDPILQENDSFLKLLAHYSENLNNHSQSSFDPAHFFKMSKKEKEKGEPIWGRRNRANSSEEDGTDSTRPSYGSVLAFDTDELDPENSLSGFLDHVPMSLRRWACYPMLLGRLRRNFKHVMLVDVKEMLILGDPLSRVRTLRPESVLLTKHGKKNSEKTQSTRHKWVNPGVVMGGSRGVRRLANAMLNDIVRASMQQHKKRSPVTESGLFNQLVVNEFVLTNVQVTVSTESVPELSSLGGKADGNNLFLMGNYSLIRRGNSNLGVNTVVMKHICSFALDSTVYNDC